MLGAIVSRAIIVLVVFPVVGHAIYVTLTWLVGRALPALTIEEAWAATVDRAVVGAVVLTAALGAWSFCRRLWRDLPLQKA